MKTEFLNELGLTEEQVKAVMAENGKDVQREKEKVSRAESERDGYKEQLETTQDTLKEFEGIDVKELQGKVTELTGTIKTQSEEFAKKLSDIEYAKQIDSFFEGYKFTSDLAKKAAIEEFKAKELKLDNGKFLGGEDFMEQLKAKNPTAFEGEEKPPIVVKGTNQRKPGQKMSLTEAMAYKNAHPDADITTLI